MSKAHIWELAKGRADNPAMALVVRLADHFGVSVSFMVDEDLKDPEADDDLKRMFRQAGTLDERDRKAIDALIQSFVAQKGKGPRGRKR